MMTAHTANTAPINSPPAVIADTAMACVAQTLNEKLLDVTGSRLLSRHEFCSMCNISVSTAERWDRIEYGPRPVKIGPRRIGYRLSGVLAFIEGRSAKTAA